MNVFANLFRRSGSDVFVDGSLDLPTIVLIDIDEAKGKLEELFRAKGYPILILSLGNVFPSKGIYDLGTRLVRSQIFSKLIEFDSGGFRLVVSSDLDNRIREVVDVANKLGISTNLLSFETLKDGNLGYRNYREGYEYPIVDVAFFVNPLLGDLVAKKNKGPSKVVFAGVEVGIRKNSSEFHEVLKEAGRAVIFIESMPQEYVSWLVSYARELEYKIYMRQDLLKKDERSKLERKVEFLLPGSRYERIRDASDIVLFRDGPGYSCFMSGKTEGFLKLDDYILALFDGVDGVEDKSSMAGEYHLDFQVVREYLNHTQDKTSYKTLVLNLKRGDNLFGSLQHYLKLLGCGSHIIYRGGDIDGDIYASFGLPDQNLQSKLVALANKSDSSKPYYNIENGFLAFTGIALLDSAASHSLILDSKSLYFDGVSGSSMEDHILFGPKPSQGDLELASECIERITKNNLSKYNHAPVFVPLLPGDRTHKVLVVDQRYGDKSIGFAGADESTFRKMLMDAYEENPHSDIIVKVHPDALTGLVKGHFDRSIENLPNVYLYSEDINPLCLLRTVDTVYVCSSQMGFEALMMGLNVNVYGLAIYGGWGLTSDRVEFKRRGNETRSLEEIFYWMYLYEVPYIGPVTKEYVDIHTYIDELMVARGSANINQLKAINVGDGQLVKNPVTQYFSLIKEGKVTQKTILNLLVEVGSLDIRAIVLRDLALSSGLPEDATLLRYILSFLKQETDISSLIDTLVEYPKLNDLFNCIVVFAHLFGQHELESLIGKLVSPKSSAILIEKVFHWAFGEFIKRDLSTDFLEKELSRVEKLNSDKKEDLVRLYLKSTRAA